MSYVIQNLIMGIFIITFSKCPALGLILTNHTAECMMNDNAFGSSMVNHSHAGHNFGQEFEPILEKYEKTIEYATFENSDAAASSINELSSVSFNISPGSGSLSVSAQLIESAKVNTDEANSAHLQNVSNVVEEIIDHTLSGMDPTAVNRDDTFHNQYSGLLI